MNHDESALVRFKKGYFCHFMQYLDPFLYMLHTHAVKPRQDAATQHGANITVCLVQVISMTLAK